MGTRGMTAVVMDGEFKIAQYGQYDHYPEGQGKTVLAFCREWLTDPVKTSQFIDGLQRLREVTEDEIKLVNEMNPAQFERSEYALLSRNVGGDVLEAVATGTWNRKTVDYVGGKVVDASFSTNHGFIVKRGVAFFRDSLFCEWAYVVDLDGGFLEIYHGFNKEPVPEGERFAGLSGETLGKASSEYHPVRLVTKFSLDDLPDQKSFEAKIEKILKERNPEDYE